MNSMIINNNTQYWIQREINTEYERARQTDYFRNSHDLKVYYFLIISYFLHSSDDIIIDVIQMFVVSIHSLFCCIFHSFTFIIIDRLLLSIRRVLLLLFFYCPYWRRERRKTRGERENNSSIKKGEVGGPSSIDDVACWCYCTDSSI